MRHFYLLLLLFAGPLLPAQVDYFPPALGDDWATTDPADLGWDTDALPAFYDYLADNNTKAFLVLHNGRIVVERYFDSFTRDSSWYWASAGKSLTSVLVGQALHDGLLALDDPASDYLGAGWTSCPAEDETAITIRDQLSMASGLNGQFGNCPTPDCLQCLVEPGTRWAYHNAPYRKLREVVEAASGQSYNAYTRQQIMTPIGGRGFWIIDEEQLLFISTPRTMARFGLLQLARGNWAGTQVQRDSNYLRMATSPSQSDNPSYGYLWWLNGQDRYRLPGDPRTYDGPLTPTLPDDAYAALGKNGQMLDVIPSAGLVVVRMGNAPRETDDTQQVGFNFHRALWDRLGPIVFGTTSTSPSAASGRTLYLSPNPTAGRVSLLGDAATEIERVTVLDAGGRLLFSRERPEFLDVSGVSAGVYFVIARLADGSRVVRRLSVRPRS